AAPTTTPIAAAIASATRNCRAASALPLAVTLWILHEPFSGPFSHSRARRMPMGTLSLFGLGTLAGLHGALYGAYKDSPHESFLFRRFVREVAFASLGAVALPVALPAVSHQSAFTVYLALFALTRIITEFWKLFLRVEPQGDFRIPTQMHCVVGVVGNPVVRLLLGIGFLGSIYGCYEAFRLIPGWVPAVLNGSLVGLGIGTAEALAGGFETRTLPGFSMRAFFASPRFAGMDEATPP